MSGAPRPLARRDQPLCKREKTSCYSVRRAGWEGHLHRQGPPQVPHPPLVGIGVKTTR